DEVRAMGFDGPSDLFPGNFRYCQSQTHVWTITTELKPCPTDSNVAPLASAEYLTPANPAGVPTPSIITAGSCWSILTPIAWSTAHTSICRRRKSSLPPGRRCNDQNNEGPP